MDSTAPPRTERLRFGRYVLDLARGCLTREGEEIPLRPKTFAVLNHLVANPGRLVSKDDLFAAVWPNIAVTDDALVQSIGELRRALGDEGARLIATVPRRGYRFDAEVSPVGIEAPSQTHGNPVPAEVIAATHPPGRWALYAALAFVLVIAGGSALWIGLRQHQPAAAQQSAEQMVQGMKPAIAILPFRNQADEAREYFADGLTQDVINALGRFPALTVMSWNAVFPLKGKPANPEQIARSLAVRYFVEGSVRQTTDRLRVTAQLVDRGGRVLWSGRFDEALSDVFALHDRMTTEIAGALAIRVTQNEQRRAIAKPTASLEAYDYVLRARPALQRPARGPNVEARALLRRAIELDPSYAAAFAALAETYYITVSMGWAEQPSAALARADEFARKALSFDESDVHAHIVLSRIHILHQRYDQAKSEIDRAIAINPSDAHALAARGNILLWSGQTSEAVETLELAQRIDPELHAFDRFGLSLAYYLQRRYDAAIEQGELNLRRTRDARFSEVLLAAAYAQLGRTSEAARVSLSVRRNDPAFDPEGFGSKLLNAGDLDHLREGLRKAGLY